MSVVTFGLGLSAPAGPVSAFTFIDGVEIVDDIEVAIQAPVEVAIVEPIEVALVEPIEVEVSNG